MADKQYKITFTLADGSKKSVAFTAPQGDDYVLTEADKVEIAEEAVERLPVYEGEAEGGEIATGDWNAKEGEAGHILNRTHWSEIGLVELISERSVEGWGYTSGPNYINENVDFEEGKTYIVVFDGTSYECVAWQNPNTGIVCIGRGSILGVQAGEDVPFCCSAVTYMAQVFFFGEEGTHTIKVSCESEVVHTLDKKYLPDDVANDVLKLTAMDLAIDNNQVAFTALQYENGSDVSYASNNYEKLLTYVRNCKRVCFGHIINGEWTKLGEIFNVESGEVAQSVYGLKVYGFFGNVRGMGFFSCILN